MAIMGGMGNEDSSADTHATERSERHTRAVAAFPNEVREAHKHCRRNRAELLASTRCRCFYCIAIFPPDEVVEWVNKRDREGRDLREGLWTALCPHCGIDSVVGDHSNFPITKVFLTEMHRHWFAPPPS